MNVPVIVVLVVLLPVAFGAGVQLAPRLRKSNGPDTAPMAPVPPAQDPTLVAPPLQPAVNIPSQWDGTPVTPITPAPVAELSSTGRHFPENRNEQSELINVDELHRMLAADTGPIRLVGPAQN